MPRGRAPSPTANRTDLTAPSTPVAAPNQEYGAAGAQLAAQAVVPVAGGNNAPNPGGNAAPSMADAFAAHASNMPVGAHGPLDRPTERPNEPVTHGLPVGPGGGPEVLQGVGALQSNNAIEAGTLANLLQNMAASPQATTAIQYLAGRAQGGTL